MVQRTLRAKANDHHGLTPSPPPRQRRPRSSPTRIFSSASACAPPTPLPSSRPPPDTPEIVRERARWLELEPVQSSALLAEGNPLVTGTAALAQQWNPLAAPGNAAEPHAQLLPLEKSCEPDFLLLRGGESVSFRLIGACVCFPSSWALEEKVHRPIAEIHAPAPTLNATLGAGINQFLGRIRPGAEWARTNWGLS